MRRAQPRLSSLRFERQLDLPGRRRGFLFHVLIRHELPARREPALKTCEQPPQTRATRSASASRGDLLSVCKSRGETGYPPGGRMGGSARRQNKDKGRLQWREATILGLAGGGRLGNVGDRGHPSGLAPAVMASQVAPGPPGVFSYEIFCNVQATLNRAGVHRAWHIEKGPKRGRTNYCRTSDLSEAFEVAEDSEAFEVSCNLKDLWIPSPMLQK